MLSRNIVADHPFVQLGEKNILTPFLPDTLFCRGGLLR
jgi:hypothetical protein